MKQTGAGHKPAPEREKMNLLKLSEQEHLIVGVLSRANTLGLEIVQPLSSGNEQRYVAAPGEWKFEYKIHTDGDQEIRVPIVVFAGIMFLPARFEQISVRHCVVDGVGTLCLSITLETLLV